MSRSDDAIELSAHDAAELLLVREAVAAEVLALPDIRHRLPAEADARGRLLFQARAALEQDSAMTRLAAQLPWLTGRRPGAWLLLPALLAGALFSGLTTGGRFNILAPPLLGLLLWQLLIYAWLLWPRSRADARPLTRRLPALLWFGRRFVRSGAGKRLAAVPGRFVAAFADTAPALLLGRLAATLHAAAAAFALGAILGIYWDGLGVAYHAYWESTFLGPDTVSTLIALVLTPASLITGIALPDAAEVAAMASTAVPAAPWIHLWATTLVLVAVLPRLALTGLAMLQVRRHAIIEVDGNHPTLRRILAHVSGTRLTARIQPLGYRPDAATLERLRDRLDEHFHGQVQAEVAQAVAADPDALPPIDGELTRLVLLMNPAQTPELEIHGPLFSAAARQAALCVVLDASAYRTSAERRKSRITAWQRLLDAQGIEHLELKAPT
ncbi:MAG: DUF2868 domain-containing protein [Gammaproteobacteria bacterium]|nr:DUF2868 domain-containing protein [Gammaproteobacteria bacterium]